MDNPAYDLAFAIAILFLPYVPVVHLLHVYWRPSTSYRRRRLALVTGIEPVTEFNRVS